MTILVLELKEHVPLEATIAACKVLASWGLIHQYIVEYYPTRVTIGVHTQLNEITSELLKKALFIETKKQMLLGGY